jgi:pimeloyl-ACP methyl ester carboxylesterase
VLLDVDQHPIAWREAGSGDLVLFLHGIGHSRIA